MEICIIGLPKSGKTTIFNALTRGKAEVTAYASPDLTPNIGITKVPDPRLETLKNIFQPKKITPAEIKYTDIAGITKNFSKDEGISGPFLNYLSNADALVHIVRAFGNKNVPHTAGNTDTKSDIATMEIELIFSDLAIIERKLGRLNDAIKGAKSTERELHLREQALLEKIRAGFDKDIPIWQQSLTSAELKGLSNYQFLSAKPMLIVINIGEEQIKQSSELEAELRSTYSHPLFEIVALCGKLEMELTQINDTESEEFRTAMGLTIPALDRVIDNCYRLLGLISFFTTVSSELKVWTISKGDTALKAARKIHSDIEKGFIRAEVISFPDLKKCGNLTEARKQGLLRLEGKKYVVQDGDMITFRFNI